MRTVVGSIGAVALLLGLVQPATASLPRSAAPDLTPMIDVLAAIEDGTAGDAIVTPGSGPIVSQFQVVANLGANPAFYDDDIGVEALGVDTAGSIVDLGGVLTEADLAGQLPPLDPNIDIVDISGQPRVDLRTIFDGWEAFGEFGPIDGPVPALPTNTMFWGFELAQPFDTSCGTAQAVGRAWESQSIVSADAPFEAGALAELWGGTHEALADGTLGRLIQLNCYQGASPAVETMRMNPDFGRVRAFGPLEIVALVKGNLVVFAGRLNETEDHARDVTYFATGSSGSVETVAGGGPIPLVVPNPYEAVPDRIDFVYDVSSIEAISASGDPLDADLLYRGPERGSAKSASGGVSTPVGLSCSIGMRLLYITVDELGLDAWGPQTSTWRSPTVQGDLVDLPAEFPDGSGDLLQLDFSDLQFDLTILQGPDNDEPDCRVSGSFTVTCASECSFASAVPQADDGGSSEALDCVGDDCTFEEPPLDCSGDDCPAASGDGDGGSSLPLLGGVALAVGVCTAGAVYVTKARREDPAPEEYVSPIYPPNMTPDPASAPDGYELQYNDDGSSQFVPIGTSTSAPDSTEDDPGSIPEGWTGVMYGPDQSFDESTLPEGARVIDRGDGVLEVWLPPEDPTDTAEFAPVEESTEVGFVEDPEGYADAIADQSAEEAAAQPDPVPVGEFLNVAIDMTDLADGDASPPADGRPEAVMWSADDARRWFRQHLWFSETADGVRHVQLEEDIRITVGPDGPPQVQSLDPTSNEWRNTPATNDAELELCDAVEAMSQHAGDAPFDFGTLGADIQQRFVDALFGSTYGPSPGT